MTSLVLASKSAVRTRLLSAAGVEFEAVDSGLDETVAKAGLAGQTPEAIALALAEAKALRVSMARPDDLVIGADQTLDFEGRLFDKATSLAEARERLVMLRGRSHRLHAGIAVARGDRIVWRKCATSNLTMRDFSDTWLDGYLERNSRAALSSVGCYELEGEGAQLFDRIVGDYFAILGLPLLGLLGCLRKEGALPQ